MIKVIEDYITVEEEMEILSKFPKRAKSPDSSRNFISRYGSSIPYGGSVDSNIPTYFTSIMERLNNDGIINSDSVTVNEYKENQNIDWHIDSLQSGPVIVVLSLKGSAIMGLRKGDEYKELTLKPRSLLILSQQERYDWEHCIYPVKEDRYSIVFRKGTHVNI